MKLIIILFGLPFMNNFTYLFINT